MTVNLLWPWYFSDVCVLRKVGKALSEMSCSTSEKVAVIIVCEAMIWRRDARVEISCARRSSERA